MVNIKVKTILRLSFILFIITLLGGGVGMADVKEKNTFIMTKGNETHITINEPGEFLVKIESNLTTGYSWSLQKPTDETLVKFKGIKEPDVEDDEEEGSAERPLLGAPSYETFVFEALQPGKTEILLKYHRPWEKDTPPEKTHKIVVTIE
jgi:predicted secreted protein